MTDNLLTLIKTKNRKAQEEFYYKYSEQLFRICYRYVTNEQDGASIINSGFLKIFDNIGKVNYINEASFIAWMKKIIINEALMFLRQRIKYLNIEDNQPDSHQNLNFAETNLEIEDYYTIIKNLPDDYRTVFNLFAIDGYTHAEIATILNIKESSSRVYLTRARKALIQKLT